MGWEVVGGMISIANTYFWEGVPHTGTEYSEHIQIIITSAQEADNVIPYQLQILVKRYIVT